MNQGTALVNVLSYIVGAVPKYVWSKYITSHIRITQMYLNEKDTKV